MMSAEDYTLIIGELYIKTRLLSQELEDAKQELEQRREGTLLSTEDDKTKLHALEDHIDTGL